MTIRRLVFLGSVFVLAGVMMQLPEVFAVTQSIGSNLTTSPVLHVINATPGSTVSTNLYVENNSSVATTIDTTIFTFGAYGTSGKPALHQPTPQDTYIKWATLTPSTLIAQPHVLNTVVMTISMPPSAALGYNYAVLFSSKASSQGSKNLETTYNGSNAILILLNATSSTEHQGLAITSFTADKSVYEYLPVNLSVTVKNTGNIFFPPDGTVYVSKNSNFPAGSIISTIPLNQKGGNVLPNTSRTFTATWDDGFPVFKPKMKNGAVVVKNNKTVYALDWNLSNANKFRFGKFYAKTIMTYRSAYGVVPVTAVVSFWVIPWKFLSIVLLVIILVGFGIYALLRPFINRLRGRPSKKRRN